MNTALDRVQALVSAHMSGVLSLFRPGAKITVAVRSPAGEEAPGARDFIMTDDDLEEVVRMIERRARAVGS